MDGCDRVGRIGERKLGDIAELLLRIAHAFAAAIWLGGGFYYVIVLRPQVRKLNDQTLREFSGQIQKEFGEWALVATLIMLATGVVLMFDRVADGQGTALYALLLAIKIAAAIVAFWLTGVLKRGTRRARNRTGRFDRGYMTLAGSSVAFLLGIVLSAMY